MLDPTALFGPFAKRLGENLADRISKSRFIGKGDDHSKETMPTKEKIDTLRAENEQLKAYIFIVLKILSTEMAKSTKGGPDDEV